jgi:hypothetical protein
MWPKKLRGFNSLSFFIKNYLNFRLINIIKYINKFSNLKFFLIKYIFLNIKVLKNNFIFKFFFLIKKKEFSFYKKIRISFNLLIFTNRFKNEIIKLIPIIRLKYKLILKKLNILKFMYGNIFKNKKYKK